MSDIVKKLLAAGILLFAAGCGGGKAKVAGLVTFDGKALADGRILFEAADGKSPPVEAKITEGRYEAKLPPGTKKVRINASRPADKIDPLMKTAPMISFIPKEYNTATKLGADIKAGGQEGVNFDLKAVP